MIVSWLHRLKELAEITEDAFLAGPDRYAEWLEEGNKPLLVIDDIFAKPLKDVLEDAIYFDKSGLDLDPDFPETPSLSTPDYVFRPVGDGVLLISPSGDIVGGYVGCDVTILPEHQGKGLGAELILERFLRHESFPVWDHDKASFTRAGEAAHRAAWRLLQDDTFVSRKMMDLEPPEESDPETNQAIEETSR